MHFARSVVLLMLLATAPAYAQRAIILQLPGGSLVGIAYTPSGQIVLTDITIIKVDSPVPPNPTTVAEKLVVLRDQRTATPQQVAILLDLQEKYQRGTKLEMFLLDRTDPGATAYVNLKPSGDAYPFYFLVGAGGKVIDKGPMPPTFVAMEERISKFKGAK